MRNGSQQHHDAMARVVIPVTDSPESWWTQPMSRDAFMARAHSELTRMRHSKFGRMLGANLGSELALPEPRNRKGVRGYAL